MKLNVMGEQIFNLTYNNSSITEFEQWVYKSTELEELVSPEDYFALISLDYSNKYIYSEIKRVTYPYIDYGKLETFKMQNLLNQTLSRA